MLTYIRLALIKNVMFTSHVETVDYKLDDFNVFGKQFREKNISWEINSLDTVPIDVVKLCALFHTFAAQQIK